MSWMYVIDPGFADVVVCQCRRCACKCPGANDLSPFITRTEVKSSPKSYCDSRKMPRNKWNISPTINSQTEKGQKEDQVVKVKEIDIPVVPISAIPVDKDPSN